MRRNKVTGLRRVRSAPAQQHVAVDVVDAQSRRLFRSDRPTAERIHARAPDELADVDPIVVVDEDVLRSLNVEPVAEEGAIRAEDLDTVIFAVADEDSPVGVHPGAVRHTKLAVLRSRLAPRFAQLA